MLKESSQYTEKKKLAEQLFTQGPKGDNVRLDKAGYSRRQKTEQEAHPASQKEQEDALPALRKTPELLLDLSDSGTIEASEPEHPGEDNLKSESERTENVMDDIANESLLEGLVSVGDAEAIPFDEQLDNLEEGNNSKQQNQSTEEQTSSDDLLISDLESIDLGVASDVPTGATVSTLDLFTFLGAI